MLSLKKFLKLSDHSVDQIDNNLQDEEFLNKLSLKLDEVKNVDNAELMANLKAKGKTSKSPISPRNKFGFRKKSTPDAKSPLSISPVISTNSVVSSERKKRWFGSKEKVDDLNRSNSVSERSRQKSTGGSNDERSNSVPVRRRSSAHEKSSLIHEKSASNSRSASVVPVEKEKPRFRMLENGSHEHYLRAAKGQEKLSSMLKDLLGAKKLRDEAKSALPSSKATKNAPPTLFSGLVKKVQKTEVDDDKDTLFDNLPTEMKSINNDTRCFVEKYGRCQEVIGKGSFGVVRVSHKKVVDEATHVAEVKLYAVKEFKRRPSEPEKKYNKRLTSEFVISSSLKNLNIIETMDLLKDANGDYCEVMEYCAGGDLYTLIIAAGKLEYAEADCFFKQLIHGVNYMHDMGIAHRDLKPENLLITQAGVVKITDFGNSECFKVAWDLEIQLSEGICGSSPYIAPEEFVQKSFDPRCVDIWSCGVIYMAMRTGRQLWKLADPSKDEFFEEYLTQRKEQGGYEPIESLKRARCRNVIYSILDPKPERRITGKQILNSEWGREIKICQAGEGKLVVKTPPPETLQEQKIREEKEEEEAVQS